MGNKLHSRPAGARICSNAPQLEPTRALADPTFERHYRIGELARLWAVGRETLRKIFKDEPGVVKIRIGKKKSHVTYSIPESVAHRVHVRLSAAA